LKIVQFLWFTVKQIRLDFKNQSIFIKIEVTYYDKNDFRSVLSVYRSFFIGFENRLLSSFPILGMEQAASWGRWERRSIAR
jgi:hypothetical protein